jgi:hypothetical protein
LSSEIFYKVEKLGEFSSGSRVTCFLKADLVRLALSNFTDVFQHIPPHEQKEPLRLMVHKAVLTEDTVKIALCGRPPEIGPVLKPAEARCQMGEWLPGQMSESAVLWDRFALEINRVVGGHLTITVSI